MPRQTECAADSPAIDLIRTSGRGGVDLIASPAMLEDWLLAAGFFVGPIPLNISHVRQARELRTATFRCALAAIAKQELLAADVETINRLATMPTFRPQLEEGRLVVRAKNPRNAVLSLLAAHAIEMLTVHRDRLHACPDCNMPLITEAQVDCWCSQTLPGNEALR